MKIALISPPWWLFPSKNIATATEHLIEDFAYNIKDNGHDSIIFCRDITVDDKYPIKDLNLYKNKFIRIPIDNKDSSRFSKRSQRSRQNYNYDKKFFYRYIDKIIYYLKQYDITNIIVFQSMPFGWRIKKFIPNSKIFYHVGCMDLAKDFNYLNYGYVTKRRANFFFKYMDKIVCVSNFLKNEILKRFPKIEDKIVSIYPGFSVDKSALPKYPLLKIGYFGRVVEEKGIVCLIQAFKALKKEYSNLRLYVWGPTLGPNMQMDTVQSELKSAQHVYMGGNLCRRRVYEKMKLMDIVVYPTMMDETFGLVPIEALSISRAVVISDQPAGYHEILEDGVNCLVFKSGDSEDLKIKLKKLLVEKPLYKRLVLQGIKDIQKNMGWSKIISKLIKEFNN